MKKIIIVLVLVLSGCDGSIDTTGYKLIEPDFEYELDTWGSNSEIYEITPKSNKNYTCIMLMLDSGRAMGLQCFPKPITE